jgi:hypothetical protein
MRKADIVILALVVPLFSAMGFGIYYLDRSGRVSSAKELLDTVSKRAAAYYTAEHRTVSASTTAPQFPMGLAPFEEGPECGCQSVGNEKGCPPNAPIWDRDGTWQALGFSQAERHLFKVSYEGQRDRFVVTVRGDKDCDGVLAEFRRVVKSTDVNAPDRWATTVSNQFE